MLEPVLRNLVLTALGTSVHLVCMLEHEERLCPVAVIVIYHNNGTPITVGYQRNLRR